MPSQYIYNHNAETSAGSNVDLSAKVRAYRTVMKANAEEGSVAISTVIVDDEDASLDIKGHRTFFWKESSEGSNYSTILHGFVADRTVSRGPFKVERARQWSVNVTDLNTLLGRPIMRGSDANRPAETDVARMQWLMGTGEMNLIPDTTYLSTASPVDMDANDYRDQTALSVIDDCAQQSGKNYFVFRNEFTTPPKVGIFYDFDHSTAYSSGVRLTNVLSDVDSTNTYAVLNEETQLNRDPSRVYSSVLLPFNGGEVFDTLDSTRIAFARRDVTSPSVNVRTTTKAHARALRYLQDNSTEEDRITVAYLVPLAKVNRLREGQTFQLKLSHLPGYTDWTWVRILSRQTEAISEEFYKVVLECTTGAPSTAGVASCATQVSSMQNDDSGKQFDLSAFFSPIAWSTIDNPSTYPGVVIGFMAMANNAAAFGTGPTGSVSGFTLLNGSREGACSYPFGFSTMAICGYKALSAGSPGSMTVSWAGGGNPIGWRGIAAYLRTSATSPVQKAAQCGSGNTLTFASTPTVGNIIVVCFFSETGGATGVPAGFTKVAGEVAFSGNPPAGAIDSGFMDIWVRCVQQGDTATYGTGDSSFSHWAFASEWALT